MTGNRLRAGVRGLRAVSSRDFWRVLGFDVVAPLATIAGLVVIGVILTWPKWWVAVCAVLVLLVVEGMLLDVRRQRLESVTVGTDDRRPLLRLAVVTLCAAALVATAVIGYTSWMQPDRERADDKTEVVRVAAEVAEAAATVAQLNPGEAIDRAAKLFAPDRAVAFKDTFGRAAADQALAGVTVESRVMGAGVEVISSSGASVVVMLHNTGAIGDQPPKSVIATRRVKLTKRGDRWLVIDMAPVATR